MPFTEMARFQRCFGGALASSADAGTRVVDPALARALAVHRNTAAKAAQTALAANYPVVQALFGDAAFGACAAAYVRLYPPREPRLNAFGRSFATFLRGYDPARAFAYLPDVADLERLCTESLFAADAEPAKADELAAHIAKQSSPRLHPATRWRQFATPAVSIWRAHQASEAAAFEAIVWSAEGALVTRPFGAVRVTLADPGLLAFLRACGAGADLTGAALAADAAGADFSTLLPILIEAGALA
jgi:Putative DNA-binding domain